RRRGRRPRLFHQGSDGARIRRCRLQDVSWTTLEPGEDAIRLARHQGRGQAHQAAAGIREGEGPDRGLFGAQGAIRLYRQAAPERQGRAARQGGRAEEKLTSAVSLFAILVTFQSRWLRVPSPCDSLRP